MGASLELVPRRRHIPGFLLTEALIAVVFPKAHGKSQHQRLWHLLCWQ